MSIINDCQRNSNYDEFEVRMIRRRRKSKWANRLESQFHSCKICTSEAYKTALDIIHRSELDPPSKYVFLLHNITSHLLGLGDYKIV